MLGSIVVYGGLVLAFVGVVACVKPVWRLGMPTCGRALAIVVCGIGIAVIGLLLPVSDSRVRRTETRLDAFVPVWQFREVHAVRIKAPPDRVFAAIKRVRPDEILLLRTLVNIRAGWRPMPENVQQAARRFDSMIDIATHSTFVMLADDPPREIVVGTVVGWPPGGHLPVSPELFQLAPPPGIALAAMNFIVKPDGGGGSIVSTETRVFANSAPARRRFAVYWRVIYPGSSLIRWMWLRAIARRAAPSSASSRVGETQTKLAVVFAAVVLGIVRIRAFRRRRLGRLHALGFSFEPRHLGDAAAGLAIGTAAIAVVFVTSRAMGATEVEFVRSPATLLTDLGSVLGSAATEELVFRSLLLGGLLVVLPRVPWVALVVSAAVFGGLHAFNEHANTLAVVGTTIGGLCYGLAFATTNRIWMSMALHFGWNYAMGPVFGFPISGSTPMHQTLVQQRTLGADWFTGGAYGPEGGVVGLAGRAVVVALLIAYLSRIVAIGGILWSKRTGTPSTSS